MTPHRLLLALAALALLAATPPADVPTRLTRYPAETRGHTQTGWLSSWHRFSFGQWRDPRYMGFGALRVLNDDTVAPGKGFGLHPHRDMEIVSIPLAGALAHQDDAGHAGVVRAGQVQIMSAGTGIRHAEMNASETEAVAFLQLWVLPRQRGLKPRYAEAKVDSAGMRGGLAAIVAPDGAGGALPIMQDAWFYLADLAPGDAPLYTLRNPDHGVFLYVLNGELQAAGETLRTRDGLGLEGLHHLPLRAELPTQLLLIEVPMAAGG